MAGAGGYDCEFVEKPPDSFPQTECPICNLILREPQQVRCCGNSYCEVCINRVRGNRCPTCNEANLVFFPDKRLKRSLYDFHVHCCHRGDGCEWAGPLRELDNHLNLRPSPEKRLAGCPFAEVECIYCRNTFQRRHCKDHQSDDCPKRPHACQHCRYKATFEEITEKHLPACPLSPVACPACEVALHYQELEHHVDQDCPLMLISCDFHAVGCPVQLAQKDMPSHIRHNLDQHIALLNEHVATHPGEDMSMYTPLLVKSVTLYRELKHEKERREEHIQIQYLFFILAMLVSDFIVAGSTELAMVLGILLATAAIVKLTNVVQYFFTATRSNTVQFTMTEFQKHKNAEDIWYSPAFYTHSRGYRMCLGVRANGYGRGYRTHVSVFAYLMPGAFDDELRWPFRGKVTITLCDQVSKSNTHTCTSDFADSYDRDIVRRVTSGRRAAKGWGVIKFIPHSKLCYKANSQSQYTYLKNSCLIFQVKVDTPQHP